jgi:hypothetical protein
VAREVAQQVAAGYPRRQREALLGGRLIDAAFDLEVMPLEIGQANAITDQNQVLCFEKGPKNRRIVA